MPGCIDRIHGHTENWILISSLTKNKLAEFDLQELRKLLLNSQKVTITTHVSPDGDAIGSSLALMFFLEKEGLEAKVITPDSYPEFLQWLPRQSEVLKYDEDAMEAEEWISKSDLIFCLDFNSPDRLSGMRKVIESSTQTKVLIDHHRHPQDWVDILLSDPEASSTSELIYRVIAGLNKADKIDESMATCLYTGIVTDTGSFKFPSTSALTLEIAAELVRHGIDAPKIQNLIYDNSSEDRLRLLGYALTKKLQIIAKYHTAVIGLDAKELRKYNYKAGDTEGIVNYPLSISTVWMSVFISEKGNDVRMSFRSKGKVPVHEISAKYFHGGGHINAAGGISDKSVADTITYLLSILEDYSEHLC